jgi:hypothetical protein
VTSALCQLRLRARLLHSHPRVGWVRAALSDQHDARVPFAESQWHLGRPFDEILQLIGMGPADEAHATYDTAAVAAGGLASVFDVVEQALHALEPTRPGAEALALAQYGAAAACTPSQDIASALSAVERGQGTPEPAAREAVCHWSGTSAPEIAELITARTCPAYPSAHDDHGSQPLPSTEGATSR